MRTRKARLAALAGVITLLVAACGSNGSDQTPDPTAAPGTVQVTVVASEFGFEPASIQVPADTPVQLTLENRGVVEHDFTIDELGIHIYAAAGETVTETITVPAGTHHLHCSVPGHLEAGMEGTITAG